MTFSAESEIRKIERRLAKRERVGWWVLLIESLSCALWRPLSWFFLFAGLWLLNLPALLGNTAEILTVIVFVLGLTAFIFRDFRHLRLPGKALVRRRIEKESQLAHRPLSTLEDELANPQSPQTREIWKLRAEWLARTIAELKSPALQPVLARRDPYALRYASLMVLALGLITAGPLWQQRLVSGLFPVRITPATKTEATSGVTLRIVPPEYTGLAESIIQEFGKGQPPLEIAEGSRLKFTVTRGLGKPSLDMGGHSFPMKVLSEDTYGLEAPVLPGEDLVVRQLMLPRARMPYVYLNDVPPRITASGEPETLPKGALQFPLVLTDDYGVKDLTLKLALDPVIKDAPLGEPVDETRLVMSPGGNQETEIRPVYDFTGHTWSGLPVVLTLQALDGGGQKSDELQIKVVLPERSFTHPVAAFLNELRKQLAWLPEENAQQVSLALHELTNQPETFDGDIVVFLALRTAAARLAYSPGVETARAVIGLLWETALRLDDGNLTLAMNALKDAQKSLEETLRNPEASDEEIARAMDDLQNALASYLQELAEEIQRRMAEGQPVPVIPPGATPEVIDPQSLSAFLDQLRAEALSGNKTGAQEMLSKIQRMMDMLDPSMMTEMPPDMQFMNSGKNELQELVRKQQALLDQTREQANTAEAYEKMLGSDLSIRGPVEPGKMPPAPAPLPPREGQNIIVDTEPNRAEQEALRFVLGQLMRDASEILGEIPEGMGDAEMEMRSSSEALSTNDPEGSIPHQQKAIEYLQQAMNDINQKMASRMRQMVGIGLGSGSVDPLGRPVRPGNGRKNFFGSNVKIPDEREQKRVDEILKILRRRSGDLSRPEIELDYFRRLLRQF